MPISRIALIVSLCTHSVEFNYAAKGHNDTPLRQHLQSLKDMDILDDEDLPQSLLEEIVAQDKLVVMHAYPRNSVGFYTVYHWDIDTVIEKMISIIENN